MGHLIAMGRLKTAFFLSMMMLSTQAKADLTVPEGRVLLSISGHIEETNAGDRAELDRGMLEELGLVDLRTQTPWTEGEPLFTGVPLERVLDLVSATGSVVRASAANDYAADIPRSTIQEGGAFLAMTMDGQTLTLRDKGPLWIIFPWSEQPDLDRAELHNYAVWQLLSLHVR